MVKPSTLESQITGALWGAITGDALGVPVEFQSRVQLSADPVKGMRGYGTHGQPVGTWSDDGSMLLCTVESLVTSNGLNTRDMATRFRRWLMEAYWTPYGHTFDIGIATRQAVARFSEGRIPERCGGKQEFDNGNGSLMRILPVSLWFLTVHEDSALEAVHRASCITHAHPRSQLACGFFTLFVRAQLLGSKGETALAEAWNHAESYYSRHEDYSGEWPAFKRLHPSILPGLPLEEVHSSGYCVHTLEASIWCLLQGGSFEEILLRAVNLGEDTDTTACVTGALAGLLHGHGSIPESWLSVLARKNDIDKLFHIFCPRLRV